jgi:hypothetical protein
MGGTRGTRGTRGGAEDALAALPALELQYKHAVKANGLNEDWEDELASSGDEVGSGPSHSLLTMAAAPDAPGLAVCGITAVHCLLCAE